MAWYALYTKPRHEKKVEQQLTEKGVTAFLPMTKSLRQWKDRRKWVELPLFTGYVFINILLKNKIEALQTHGVVKIISFGGVPAEIPDWQIEQLKRVISQPETLKLEQYLKEGDAVEVIEGPLKGVKGYLREIRGETRVAILLDGIYQSASFEVQKQFVKRIKEKIE
jgi:transcription elongation factor/antiterminator RfaH